MGRLDRLSEYAPVVLRAGLAIVILWFGVQQLMSPDFWIAWVPSWTEMFGMTPELVVVLNGIFEVVTGMLLLLGVYTRAVAFVLFLHLTLIVCEIGFTAIGMRDLGLAFAFLALALEKKSRLALYAGSRE